jgi:hypothetical protein
MAVSSSEDEIEEPTATTVKGAHVPADARVHEGEGAHLALAEAAGEGVVGDAQRNPPRDGARHRGDDLDRRVVQAQRALRPDMRGDVAGGVVAQTVGDGRQRALRRMLEQRAETGGAEVELLRTLEHEVAGRERPVEGDVPGGGGFLDAEAPDQRPPRHPTEEPGEKIDVEQALALRLTDIVETVLVDGHARPSRSPCGQSMNKS